MTWIFKHIIASPFILFFVFYLLSLSNNLSITHDSVMYLSQASTSSLVLSKWDVSKTYPLVGLGFVFTVAIGWIIGEQITLMRALGVAFIFAGGSSRRA